MEISTKLRKHLTDSTSLLASTSPIFQAIETVGAGMSDQVSLDARMYVVGLTYAGMGTLVGKGPCTRGFYATVSLFSKKTKRMIAAGLVAASIALSAGVYVVTPSKFWDEINSNSTIENKMEKVYSADGR